MLRDGHPESGPPDEEEETATPCPDCGEELSRSQPDEFKPGCLLGICPGCGRWFRLDDGRAPARLIRSRRRRGDPSPGPGPALA